MSLFDTDEGIETYAKMCEGYDGRALTERLVSLRPEGGELLELGMGLGKDLELLAPHFRVTGTDHAAGFLRRYRAQPDALEVELLELDATSFAGLDAGRRFDVIYSNKVLHHLERPSLVQSWTRQAMHLRPGGLGFHSFWHGEGDQEIAKTRFCYYTRETLAASLPAELELELCERYTELEDDDSMLVVLRRRA